MKKFIPDDFNPPEEIIATDFVLKKLCLSDVKLDYEAATSSINIIRQVRGGRWPPDEIDFHEDELDLAWHQREFEYRISFAYIVLNLEKNKSLGCIYIYPPDKPWINAPEGTDAVVNMWVTKEAYDKGLYPELFYFVQNWLKTNWPFKNVFCSNKEIPANKL